MTGAEYYSADPLVFDATRQRIERVLRTDLRLPAWPFRVPTGNADICQYYESVSGTFGPVLDALARAHGDTSISLVVFDPTPTYYRKHYGSYSGFTMPSENIAERYWDAISYDPRDDSAGSLTNTANTLAITGSSGAWAVWAERAWDLTIVQYTAAYVGGFQGKVHLRCGENGVGYRHINQKHAGQWVNRVTWHNYLPASQWDNFMITATRMALKGPSRAVLQPSQKACYEAPFTQTVKNSKGQVIAKRTFFTAVIVSRNNRVVITSFPPSSSHC